MSISHQIISLSLILFEGILIIISLKFVRNANKVSADFTQIFISSKEEISALFNELKKLIELSSKRENHMLHTTFHLDEMEIYIKMILKEIKLLKLTDDNKNENGKI